MKRLLNLTLHCGANEARMEQVREVPIPEATDTWCPIGHHELVDSVLHTLLGGGLRVVAEAHALTADGQRYFGCFQLQNGVQHDDYALVVGLRNSHDKVFPAGLACGSGVFCCDNLAFSGEVKLSRKHTSRIRADLPRLISTAVGRLGAMRVNQDKRIEAYKQSNITDMQAHDLIVRAVDSGALPVTRLPEVVKEWREPSFEDFRPRNAWSLFNGFTEIFKHAGNAALVARRTVPLHGLFDQLVGLKIAEEVFEDAEIEGGMPAMQAT